MNGMDVAKNVLDLSPRSYLSDLLSARRCLKLNNHVRRLTLVISNVWGQFV